MPDAPDDAPGLSASRPAALSAVTGALGAERAGIEEIIDQFPALGTTGA